jgi:hypothetical protein
MPLTKSFKEIVHLRSDRDPAFRLALFQEVIFTYSEDDEGLGGVFSRLAKPTNIEL